MKLLSITFTSRWCETRCVDCPEYKIEALAGLPGLFFNEIRRHSSWQWHKRTRRHNRNKSARLSQERS